MTEEDWVGGGRTAVSPHRPPRCQDTEETRPPDVPGPESVPGSGSGPSRLRCPGTLSSLSAATAPGRCPDLVTLGPGVTCGLTPGAARVKSVQKIPTQGLRPNPHSSCFHNH